MDFEIADAERPPPDLRERYLAALPEPQIHHVERLVARARTLTFAVGGAAVGYAAIDDGAVVEFFALDAALPVLGEVFHAVAARGGAASAVIKSYDALALSAVAGRPARVRTIGVNCTAWSDERFEPPAGFRSRPAGPGDMAVLQAVGEGLYDQPDEMAHDLAAGRVTVYEQDGEAAGCGVLSPIHDGCEAMDLGVGVLPAWRRRGVGEQIIRHLKVVCLRDRGMRPVCGCAVENVASRRTLERAGFLARHRLLQFDWDGA